jgi:hypothetical protein
MKPDDKITREFTKESLSRSLESCDDPAILKDLCKRAFNLYLNEKDHNEYLRVSHEHIWRQRFFDGILFGISCTILVVTIYNAIFIW